MEQQQMTDQRKAPRLSVITPVFNGAEHLDEAIESVLTQDFDDFEFIIFDDASTDATPEILQKWASRDPRIITRRNPVNLGNTATRSDALAAARGEYVALQDADDVSLPGRFRLQVEALDREPSTAVVSANFGLVDGRGRRLAGDRRDWPSHVVDHLLCFENQVNASSQIMFRRAVIETLGGFNRDLKVSADYDLWIRVAERSRIDTLPQVLMLYRQHPNRVSNRHPEEKQRILRALSMTKLERTIGRTLSEEEKDAVIAAYRNVGAPGNIRLADAVLRDALRAFVARFGKTDAPAIRRVHAAAIARSSVKLLRSGKTAAAMQYARAAFRWHAGSAAREVLHLLFRVLEVRMKRFGGDV